MNKIDWSQVRNVTELGAGTGVFTRSIVRRARPDARLLVFEIDPDLQRMIGLSHPGLKLYGDAQELPAILEDLGIDKLDCIVSSLPFTVLSLAMIARILYAVQDTLVPTANKRARIPPRKRMPMAIEITTIKAPKSGSLSNSTPTAIIAHVIGRKAFFRLCMYAH